MPREMEIVPAGLASATLKEAAMQAFEDALRTLLKPNGELAMDSATFRIGDDSYVSVLVAVGTRKRLKEAHGVLLEPGNWPKVNPGSTFTNRDVL